MPLTASTLAEQILTQLGQDFSLPPVDLSLPQFQIPTAENSEFGELNKPVPITVEELTDGTVNGEGSFDKIMTSNKAHLLEQYEKGRITGDQFSKAYIELTTAAMSAGVQIVLGRDQTYWQAQLVRMQGRRAEIEAITAMVQLEVTKAQLAAARTQAELVNAQYVQTAMQIARESANYQLTTEQIALTVSQRLGVDKEVEINDYKLDNIMPQELATLVQQVQVLFAQETLVKEQGEAQRGQTMDVRNDGITPILGNMGKQKELYTQQIDSYKKDAEQKVGKMYLDGWLTQKTLNEDLLAPTQLTNTNIDAVLQSLRTSHGL